MPKRNFQTLFYGSGWFWPDFVEKTKIWHLLACCTQLRLSSASQRSNSTKNRRTNTDMFSIISSLIFQFSKHFSQIQRRQRCARYQKGMEVYARERAQERVYVPHAHRFVFRSTVLNGFIFYFMDDHLTHTHDMRWYSVRLYSTYV